MKNTKKRLALLLAMVTLCMSFAVTGVSAKSTNMIQNGDMELEDWYYTQGPDGWTPGRKENQVFVESAEDESVLDGEVAYIYHKSGGVGGGAYVEIDAETKQGGEGEPKITPTNVEGSAWFAIEGNTWYTLRFHYKKLSESRMFPQITFTFAGNDGIGSFKPGSGLLFYTYATDTWGQYQIRFKSPAWADKLMLVMAIDYRKRAAYDEVSLTKDESEICVLGGTPFGLSGDANTNWPHPASLNVSNPELDASFPFAAISARQTITERPADGRIKAAFFYHAGENTDNVSCITTVYKKTEKGTSLEGCYINQMTPVAEINRLEQEITLPEKAEGAEYTVKCFIWDGSRGLKPIGVENSFVY